jgi:putative transcriptional regulator
MTAEDWKRLDEMTDDDIRAAALADPDAQPISPERLAAWKPPALSRFVRHKLRMTRFSFSQAYGIPEEILRAWERHEAEPTVVELAYLRLIEREPERAKLVPIVEHAAEAS